MVVASCKLYMLGPGAKWSLWPEIARTRQVRYSHVLKSMKTQNKVCKLIIYSYSSRNTSSDKDPVPPSAFLLGTASILWWLLLVRIRLFCDLVPEGWWYQKETFYARDSAYAYFFHSESQKRHFCVIPELNLSQNHRITASLRFTEPVRVSCGMYSQVQTLPNGWKNAVEVVCKEMAFCSLLYFLFTWKDPLGIVFELNMRWPPPRKVPNQDSMLQVSHLFLKALAA